jgi:hypothetical protein
VVERDIDALCDRKNFISTKGGVYGYYMYYSLFWTPNTATQKYSQITLYQYIAIYSCDHTRYTYVSRFEGQSSLNESELKHQIARVEDGTSRHDEIRERGRTNFIP